MLGGESSAAGTVFYDTAKKGENAVFCRFEKGSPVIESGERADLLAKMKASEAKYKGKDPFWKNAGIETLGFIAVIAAVWIFIGGFFPVFGAFLFFLIGWFPCLVLVEANENRYPDGEFFEKFRAFHGAEHMMVAYAVKNPEEWDFKEAAKLSPLHRECGTVYAASVLLLAGITGVLFGLIPQIGFLWFLGGILLSALLLFLNLLNPHNPLMLFQHRVVKYPDEKTLSLVFVGMKKLMTAENKE